MSQIALNSGIVDTIDPSLLRHDASGQIMADFLISDMHCAGCLAKVEGVARKVDGVLAARANLTARRLSVTMQPNAAPELVLAALKNAGRDARPFGSQAQIQGADHDRLKELTSAMAVAGFAAMNIMLLSVSVWSGAEGVTRDLFHWLSALIAIPAIAYAGRPFFRSALQALRHGHTNMDVPISIGVIGATLLSLYETATGGRHAWFDGSVMLIFFLLVGRVLDQRMREVARASAARLLSLPPSVARLVEAAGTIRQTAITAIRPGDVIRVLPGERVAIDGVIITGSSDLDRAFLTGESMPEAVAPGVQVHAGAMNISGVLDIRATHKSNETLLADIARLMEKVERPDGRFVRLADRAARLYAPVVHLAALATLCTWLLLGHAFHPALTAAIAVLIITCPCALGLAAPAVQIVAAGRLLRNGIVLKDGAGLEKLAEIDIVALDKTGTLTTGAPSLIDAPDSGDALWPVAAALAAASSHPLSRALAKAALENGIQPALVDDLHECPGMGVEGRFRGQIVRLGRMEWACPANSETGDAATSVWLSAGAGAQTRRFTFADSLRADASETVAALRAMGLDVALLSGDRRAAVDAVASAAGIHETMAACLPGDKVTWLERKAAAGHKVLMVGDGLNDAPALAAAHVSMSPGSGSDITQAAADLVFSGDRLAPVLMALRLARASRRKILQNFALSVGYNVLAVPIAMFGLATPLIAAACMSLSSIIVVGNALALPGYRRQKPGNSA